MSEIIKIDSAALKNYFNDFTREKNKFKNTTYNGFKSSYLNTCGDTYVRRMASNLNPLYTKINTGYENINTWWEKYLKEAEATENSITNNSISGVSEGTVRSALSSLPRLKSFNLNDIIFTLSNEVSLNLETAVNNGPVKDLLGIFGNVSTSLKGMASNVVSGITNAKNKALDWWNKKAVPVLRNGALMYGESVKMAQDVQLSTNAKLAGTVSNAGVSIFEGVGKFGEAIVDALATFGSMSAQATMFQQVTDLEFQGINTGINLDEYNKSIQEATQSFVSKEHVKSAFDNFYETNDVGKFIKDNSLAFDTVRSIGNGVGYMAGTAALSMFTFGSSAAGMAATAATAGVGKGAEEAWKNGATYNEGLTYGAATGAWEGLQYYVGAKLIGQSNIFGREGSKLFVDGSKGKVMESAARVVMDAIDSGSEGIVQPFLQSLYVDGYYDENGNYVEFLGDENFTKRWYEIFLDNGGWTGVATQAAMGGIGSAIGEALDLGKYFKDSKDTNQSMKDVIDDLEITEPVFKDVEMTEPAFKNLEITEQVIQTEITADAFEGFEKNPSIDLRREPVPQVEVNAKNLEQEILDTLDENMAPVQKIRKLYLELNKRLHYDVNFKEGGEIYKDAIYSREVSFEKFSGNNVICKGWSELFYELLTDAGIDSDRISIRGGMSKYAHKWIEIDLDSNHIIIADATESIEHTLDLMNCKAGFSTVGFVLADKSAVGKRLSRLDSKDIGKDWIMGNRWLNVDHSINYINGDNYMAEALSKAEQLFGNPTLLEKLFDENSVVDNVRRLLEADIPKDMDGVEAYNYFQRITHQVFNGDKKINVSLNFNEIENGYEGLLDLFFDDNPPIYCVYSQSLGKNIFNSKESYTNFKNSLRLK